MNVEFCVDGEVFNTAMNQCDVRPSIVRERGKLFGEWKLEEWKFFAKNGKIGRFDTVIRNDYMVLTLNATRCEKSSDHMTQSADPKEKFLLLLRPRGLSPNGDSHSYTADTTAVVFREAKMASHSWALRKYKHSLRIASCY